MGYIDPAKVISPKAHWHLFDVILDGGEGNGAYALGTWDGERRVGFRWNGNSEVGPIGNPQSRGLPTWTMLDPALHNAIVGLLPAEKQVLARRFLGLNASAEWRSTLEDAIRLHEDRCSIITAGSPRVALIGGGVLVVHVIPFSAVGQSQPRSPTEIFKNPGRFPPIGTDRPSDFRIDGDGLLTGSNAGGLGVPQRAYVHVSRSGILESVVSSIAIGKDQNEIQLPFLQDKLIKYARTYSSALNLSGFSPPAVVLASLVNVKEMHLLPDLRENYLRSEDVTFNLLKMDVISFKESVFEAVPSDNIESGKMLMPLLEHFAHAAGLPSPPYFDASCNYTGRFN